MQEKKFESRKQEYLYQLLDRLRTDCEYYLGNGNHHPQALWAGNEQGQIDKMREIWNQLKEKPEWLTWEDINDYANKMGVEDLPSTKDGTAEKEIQDMLDRNYEKEKKVGLEESTDNNLIEDLVYVYQLKEPGDCDYGFMSYEYAKDKLNLNDYKLNATVIVNDEYTDVNELLEHVFAFGNSDASYYEDNPEARSISVSDILQYKGNNYYVDSFGFVLIGKSDKLIEANIHTNQTDDIDLEKEKEEVEQQLKDVEELQAKKKELDDKVDELFEESKNIKEIKTAREVFNDSIADNSWFNSWVKNAKIVMETDNYILAVYKSKENIRLGVVSSQNPFSSAINIEITDNFKGKCVKATVNWSAVGSRSADETLEFAKLLKEAGDFCKQIEGEDFSNKLLEETKKIKMESQVSNYTFEQIGSCLKDKGNDFKIQVQGSETKTNWLNIDKEDLQKIYNTLSYKKKKTEDLKQDLGIEFGSDEESKLNELTARNLKDEFNSLTEEEQQKYLDLVPENLGPVSVNLLNKIAEQDGLDKDILYWVVNIRGGKVEEKKDPEEGFEVNEDLAWQCDSILYKNILTTYIEDTNTLLFTKYKGEDASYNDSDDIDTIVYRNQTPEEIKKYIDTNLISNKLNESIDNIIKEEQEEINKINDEIESLKHLQQAYRGENENYVQELQDEIDALLADKEILEQELEEDKKQLIEAKDANKFPSSDGTKMKLSNYDFEEAYKTVANFRDLFNKEQKEWLSAHHITMNKLYNGLKDLLSTFKVSIFKDIISIDDYIKELDKTESLNESTSTDLYNKIKNEPRSDKYEKGLKLRDEIVNAWKNNDLETADNKWEELYMLFSSPIEDLDSSVTEEQTLRNNIELNEILSTIEDQCVYDVTDYGREKDYKKMGF